MQAEFVQQLTLTLSVEEMEALQSLFKKLKDKPSSVGFHKKDFAPEESELIDKFYNLFDNK